jgi:hypothetical protein
MRLVGTDLDIRCYSCLRDVEIPRADAKLWEWTAMADWRGAIERAKRLGQKPPAYFGHVPLPLG